MADWLSFPDLSIPMPLIRRGGRFSSRQVGQLLPDAQSGARGVRSVSSPSGGREPSAAALRVVGPVARQNGVHVLDGHQRHATPPLRVSTAD